MSDAFPLGTEQEATVPLFNAWTLWWVTDRATHGFENFWQAPIFYPTEGTFTFSEPQVLTGLLVLPFWKLFGSPAATYNLALLLCLFLNGVFGYRLGRALRIPAVPSLLGGMLFVAIPITQKLLGVLPLIPFFGILWALEGFVRFGRNGTMPMALWTGGGLLVQVLTSQQLALLFAPFALPAGLLALSQQNFSSQALAKLGGAGLVVMLFIFWYAWYPIELHQALALTRPENLVNSLSAHVGDYFSKPLSASFPFPSRESVHTDTGGLFPGFLLMVLGGWGAAIGIHHRESHPWPWYWIGTGVLAFILSLGVNSFIDGGFIFGLLRNWIPGFHELRSPFRFAILAQMCLVPLSLYGLHDLRHRLPFSINRTAIVLIGIIAIGENLALPQKLTPVPGSFPSPWMSWIASQEDRHILAHVPFPSGLHVSDYQIETERMLAQMIHQKPLINGYSGYFPPAYARFQFDMAKGFPSPFLLCFLDNELGVDTLVIDVPWYQHHQEQIALFPELSEVVYRDEEVVIITIRHNPANCRKAQGTPLGL